MHCLRHARTDTIPAQQIGTYPVPAFRICGYCGWATEIEETGMTDRILTVITEAAEAYWDQQAEACEYIEFTDLAIAILAALKAARIAVVELPEPNSTRYEGEDCEFEPADRLAWWHDGSLFGISQWGYPNEVQIAHDNEPFEPVNPIEARFIAAALLAAADAAEASQ